MNNKNSQFFIFGILIVLIVIGRLIPHYPNFAPAGAAALFAAFYFRKWSVAILVPLVGMMLSDLILGPYNYGSMAFNYLALSLPILWGGIMRREVPVSGSGMQKAMAHMTRGVGLVGAGSLAFFAVSNFGVWMFSGMYALNLSGLEMCYINAIPYLHYTILGDMFYAGLLFGGYLLAMETSSGKLQRIKVRSKDK